MKELSIEEKAKAYDEALKVAKSNYETIVQMDNDCTFTKEGIINTFHHIFPELKESEDERIRRRIIQALHGDVLEISEIKEAIAWLEKQGEHTNFRNKIQIGDKVTRNEDGVLVNLSQLNRVAKKQGEQNLADKVEPKFHEGEWITNGDYTWKIVEVKPLDYILQSQDGNIVDDTISHVDEQFHSFTIEDAKDGDVLCCESGWTCIFKALDNHTNTFSSYCFMDNDKWFCNTGSECHTLDKAFIKAYNGEIYPATKEQRDLLFQKMKDAGYEWDADKKKLRKIEKKPAWSEEDEVGLANAMWAIEQARTIAKDENDMGNLWYAERWLKSLKDRTQPQQEWSEEDEDAIEQAIIALEDMYDGDSPLNCYAGYKLPFNKAAERLKSLKPQNRWKPSDEQMRVLDLAIRRGINRGTTEETTLVSLFNDLKKLRE